MSASTLGLPNMLETYQGIIISSHYLVDLRALIMVRDESTGGWIPVSKDGLSKVSVRQCSIPTQSGEMVKGYLLCGERLEDDTIILSCLIKKGFHYRKVMPTFHHWKVGEKRLGLTFQTSADARIFDKGLHTAVSDLLGGTSKRSRSRRDRASELDDDETLELPLSGVDSHSDSDSSSRSSSQTTPQDQAAQMSLFFDTRSGSESPPDLEKFDCLQLPASQECTYKEAEGTELVQQESSVKPETKATEPDPQNAAKPSKKDSKESGMKRCRYCHEIYLEEDNKRGACEYAPDCGRNTIDEVACVRAARCMTYHCMADEEGEFAQHPCECTCKDDCSFRWMGLALLSIFVPCLCLYPALGSVYWCCVQVGLCGGRHRPAS